jgi:hypothetical protein
MRLAFVFRTLAALAFIALVLVACFEPGAFAVVRDRASHSAVWLALGLIAAAFGAKLTLAVPAFGAKAHITAPLLLTLAAPYLLRATVLNATTLKSFGLRLRTSAAAFARPKTNPVVHNSDIPAALPARVATALAAAARARR